MPRRHRWLAGAVGALFATATIGTTIPVASAAGSGQAASSAAPASDPGPAPDGAAPDEGISDAPTEPDAGETPPDAGDPATSPDAPTSDADAKTLYDEGQALYSAADYPGAVTKFTEALKLISRADSTYPPDARGRLLYNLATAHDRTFNVDPDPVHLRKSIEVLQRIIDEAPVHGYEAALVEQTEAELTRVRARLEEAEAKSAPPPTEPTPTPTTGEKDEVNPNAGKALLISGIVVAGVGVACSAIWIAGVVQGRNAEDDVLATTLPSQEEDRRNAVDRGDSANTLATAGAIVSSVLVATGVALIVVGVLQRKKARRVSVVPGGPASASRLAPTPGLSMQVRF